MTEQDTKQRLLCAAAKLFAEKGFEATSLRDVTANAQVNLAAVNYHFGSKDDLYCAVFERLMVPTSARRLALLETVELSATPTLEGVLDAFVRPIIEIGHLPDGSRSPFLPLIGRIFIDRPDLIERVFQAHVFPVGERFLAALLRLLPELSELELAWRFHFMIGTMTHTLSAENFLKHLSRGAADPADIDGVVARLVAFNAAGLRAPVAEVMHA